jgi:hypothetical protein
MFLLVMGYNNRIVVDGVHGLETETGIMEFQAQYGLKRDGCFGPETRAAFLKDTGVDLDALQIEDFAGETTTPPDEPAQQVSAETAPAHQSV